MSIKFTILGCGYSFGVPRIDGYFGKCNKNEKKNYRTRCSAIISTKNSNILIDTSPDIKNQLIKNNIKNINKVFYTHGHGDQTHGINELRAFYLKSKKKIPIYADKKTKKYLLNSFKYCFKGSPNYPATLKMQNLRNVHFSYDNNIKIKIKSIQVQHGRIKCISYIINDTCAYASDVSKIYQRDLKYFKNLKYFIVDCLRFSPHPSHFNLNDVLELIKVLKPKKTILTNLNNEIDYNKVKKILPKNVIPAYDGLYFYI